MRILAYLSIFAACCYAQGAEDEVLSVFHRMEKAEQTGDADTWVSLWARESRANAETTRPLLNRPRPDFHYTSTRIFVRGGQAVLLGEMVGHSFLSMRFVKEDGRWKIKDQLWRNTPADPDSVYALAPPADGTFARAGSPWQNVRPAVNGAEAARCQCQVRAVVDESFLYVQIQSNGGMPAPGSDATKPPLGWPSMKISVAGQKDFELLATANIGDQATFDKGGKANSHRPFVSYMVRLLQGDRVIFGADAGLESDPLIQVSDPFFQIRVPLRTIGVSRGEKIVVGDAQWPKSALFSVEAARFP